MSGDSAAAQARTVIAATCFAGRKYAAPSTTMASPIEYGLLAPPEAAQRPAIKTTATHPTSRAAMSDALGDKRGVTKTTKHHTIAVAAIIHMKAGRPSLTPTGPA